MEKQDTAQRNVIDDLIRGVFMLLYFIIARFVSVLVTFTAIFQFLCVLIFDKANENVKRFGKDLSGYIAEIVLYLSYNTERKPWPFSSWVEKKSPAKKKPAKKKPAKKKSV